MSNEEIEKRFLFDLEMGIFKCLHSESHPKIISFINVKFLNKANSKLIRLLENIGFVSYYINLPSEIDSLIEINTEDKTFNVGKGYLFNVFNYNEIPYYISQYQLEPEEFV